MTYKFKKGDRFRFIRDNSDGGKEFGEKGEEFVIHAVYADDRLSFIDPNRSWKPGAYVKDIELVQPAPEKPVEFPVKATFALNRKEIEKVLKGYLESKLGITTDGFGIARLGEHEVTLEAGVFAV